MLATRNELDINTGSHPHAFQALLHCASLRRLLITCTRGTMPLESLLPGAMPQLKKLKLSHATDVSLTAVQRACPNLTHLWLEHSTVDAEQYDTHLALLPLKHMELFYCRVNKGSLRNVVSCI